MTPRSVRRLVVGAAMVAAAGCRSTPASLPESAPAPAPAAEAWTETLAGVRAAIDSGLYPRADSALDAFAERYPGTPESAEARYWRAVVSLDPVNPAATPRAALAAIDAYLALGSSQPRYVEALVLRRAAAQLVDARRPAATAPPEAPPVVSLDAERLRAATDTIRQLRSELERTQAELDRIRRRIRPSPPPAG